ncbi:MAG TPA: hypothetical protein VNA25_00175 [Phycisphaerae bacterium]|nr:hypothetical protein [Phycisphaerae bacterium]
MNTARRSGTIIIPLIAVAVALAPACGLACAGQTASASAPAGADQKISSIKQYGITWTFAAPAPAGRFVNGDWWVVGPVTVQAVDPAPAPGRSGSAVNPPAGRRQAYDDRVPGFDPNLRASFPLELRPGESLVSTHSLAKVGDKTADTVPGQYCRGPLRTAVALTCVASPPPADAFRPAFAGNWKQAFTASQLRRDLLPRLKYPGLLPDRASLERYLQRIWLDHLAGWVGRMMHPLENMPDYGRELTNITSRTGLRLLLDDPNRENETLLIRFVQLGIDLYGMTQSNSNLWPANGGHCSGRKWPIIFAGIMLDHQGMQNVRALFAEDEQTYYGEGYRGQKALWRISGEEARKHEHLPPDKWAGPPFKGDNDGWKSEGYRGLNGPTWVGTALAARLMGAKANWKHDAFFDYMDRWVREAPNGMVDHKTMKPKGYQPFHSRPGFMKGMWEIYRPKADAIGAKMRAKRQGASASTKPARQTEPSQ